MQRPGRGRRAYYSGKRKRHTLKSRVAADEETDEETGRVVHVGDSRPGRWADVKVLRRSRLRRLLPAGVGVLGDRAYRGAAAWHPAGLAATPRQRRHDLPTGSGPPGTAAVTKKLYTKQLYWRPPLRG